MQTPESKVSPIGYRNNRCGYCKNSSGSFSYYATSKSLTPEFYQGLIDRGWRRSGTLLYKPDLRASCCPHYSIRLDSQVFKATKDQRQTLNRFTNHILGEEYIRKAGRYYPKTREEALRRKQVFDVVERVYEPETETLINTAMKFTNSKSKPPEPLEPKHSFAVTLEPDTFSEEKYAIFENYQQKVHKEPPHRISRSGFKSFLCSSPIQRSSFVTENGRKVERKLGSYHQCYRLDGKLVAVGVLDLLPHCVSAVYFMNHEDVIQWNFGKLGALRETALAVEGGHRYYYMGFYIHSCIKMRYKASYHPQYILDPQTYTWDLFDDDLKRRMDARKYVCLSEEQASEARGDEVQFDGESKSIKKGRGDNTEDAEMDTDEEDDENEDTESTSSSNSLTKLPLFSLNMPGILSRTELLNPPGSPAPSLDKIKLQVRGQRAFTSDLVGWEEGSVDDAGCSKGVVADLVAAVGWELARGMVVTFD